MKVYVFCSATPTWSGRDLCQFKPATTRHLLEHNGASRSAVGDLQVSVDAGYVLLMTYVIWWIFLSKMHYTCTVSGWKITSTKKREAVFCHRGLWQIPNPLIFYFWFYYPEYCAVLYVSLWEKVWVRLSKDIINTPLLPPPLPFTLLIPPADLILHLEDGGWGGNINLQSMLSCAVTETCSRWEVVTVWHRRQDNKPREREREKSVGGLRLYSL